MKRGNGLVTKLRRLFYGTLGYPIARVKLRRREGECLRCGACCKLFYRCPFLVENNGTVMCRIYPLRPPGCRIFPLDQRDIEERNAVLPERPCGFRFKNTHR